MSTCLLASNEKTTCHMHPLCDRQTGIHCCVIQAIAPGGGGKLPIVIQVTSLRTRTILKFYKFSLLGVKRV